MIAALLMLAAASAPPVVLECPAVAGERLVYINIFDGPPEQDADLAPDTTMRPAPGKLSNVWKLDAGSDKGIFVKCAYGTKLAGPYSRLETIHLPETVKGCRADYQSGSKPDDLTLTHFSCR